MLANSASNTSAAAGSARGMLGVLLTAVLVTWFPLSGRSETATNKIDFNFQVRTILADRCFKCHGPDEKARKAKLRLDVPENAYSIRDPQKNRRAIVPSHPEQSELVRRITTSDDDDRMPPAASKLSLSDSEKDLLQRWIAQGAEYTPHWAFIAVNKP